jgi:hypothetical protein
MRRGLFYFAWLVLVMGPFLGAAEKAGAKVHLFADVGWSNHFRSGRWTPIYLTLSDTTPRQVVVEIYAPTDRRYAMKIRQSLAIGPQDTTIPIYVPFWYQLDQASVTVRDANSMRRLGDLVLADMTATPTSAPNIPQDVPGDALFIGISGNGQTERLLESQLQSDKISAGFVPLERLPASPIGYDGLDLLILNSADLGRISGDQQDSIAAWVRSGGTLMLWPGTDPIPQAGAIIGMLPCRIGENQVFMVDAQRIKSAGLPKRFEHLRGRELLDISSDAKVIELFGDSKLRGYRRWVGDGQVAVLPVDVSMLTFDSPTSAMAFWRQTLHGLGDIPLPQAPNATFAPYPPYGQQTALRGSLDWIGNIPGAGEFGFGYLAATLLGMMLIVGPVDWFVLKWLGKQPWTWVTITGWIGVVTFGAIYAGYLIKSGDVVYRTVTLIDEAGGARVASLDLAGIYSPQTRGYDFQVDPQSWWSPASDGNIYGASGLQLEIPCHQDYRGNRPEDLLINIWNLRLLEGLSYVPATTIIEAKLNRKGHQIAGTLINHSDQTIDHLRIRTAEGVATLTQSIEPGKSIQVQASLDPRDKTLSATPPPAEAQWQWYQQQQQSSGSDRPRFPLMNNLAPRRGAQIDRMLAEQSDAAVVYAEFTGGNEDRMKLNQPANEKPASEAHIGAVRAVVRMQGGGK